MIYILTKKTSVALSQPEALDIFGPLKCGDTYIYIYIIIFFFTFAAHEKIIDDILF